MFISFIINVSNNHILPPLNYQNWLAQVLAIFCSLVPCSCTFVWAFSVQYRLTLLQVTISQSKSHCRISRNIPHTACIFNSDGLYGAVRTLSDLATRRGTAGSETKFNGLQDNSAEKYFAKKVNGLQNSNPRNWWRAVKQVTGFQYKFTEPLVGLVQRLHDGDMHILTDQINKFFQQVATDLCPLSEPTTLPPSNLPLSEFIIDQFAAERKLSRISIHKAPGPDGLPNWILQDFCCQLSGPVYAIFNASIREGIVPARWKEASVMPAAHCSTACCPIDKTMTLPAVCETLNHFIHFEHEQIDSANHFYRTVSITIHNPQWFDNASIN